MAEASRYANMPKLSENHTHPSFAGDHLAWKSGSCPLMTPHDRPWCDTRHGTRRAGVVLRVAIHNGDALTKDIRQEAVEALHLYLVR